MVTISLEKNINHIDVLYQYDILCQNRGLRRMNPQKIKEIRQSLGLSQAKAGELLGGGPSAFAKYEKGSIKPCAALVKILRLLEKKPERLPEITGQEVGVRKPATTPFDVTGEDVSRLKPPEFSALIEKLLSAEALQWNLPLDGIHVASQITVTDGGEDARMEWQGGPERTSFLPNRFCQFQLKTGAIFPKEAGEEVLTRENKLKPMVREALERGASYIMLCSKPYTRTLIDNRSDSIRKSLETHGLKDPSVQFRDSGQIASWVNYHPSVAVWLLRKTRPGLIDSSFGDWKHWSGRPEHCDSPWIDDPRLPGFRKKLRAIVETPKGVARVIGPCGAGKSRLTLEAFAPTERERTSGVKLNELLLYTVESEISPHKIKEYAWNIVNSGKRAVLVVDGCSEETRIDITNIAKHSDSGLSLVTISSEIPRDAEESENTLFVEGAGYFLVEEVVKSVDPKILEWDRRRIVEFSGESITCAKIIAGSWDRKGLNASEDSQLLVLKFLGHDNQEEFTGALKVARLISAFDMVGVEAPHENELKQVAGLGDSVSTQSFRRVVSDLSSRRVLQKSGGFVTLQPKRIAIDLAEEQWEEWSREQWRGVLVGSFDRGLRIRAARQLALLNRSPIAGRVVHHICSDREFWSPLENLARNSAILPLLAEVDPRCVVNLLEYVLKPKNRPQAQNITGHIRRDLVNTLSKIAFSDNTFEEAAGLLFKLACHENENIINNATGQFASLFPVRLAATEAGPEKRLQVIKNLVPECSANPDACFSVLVKALLGGAKTSAFHRDVGPEIHGSRPSLRSWEAETTDEEWKYIKECAARLAKLAKEPDSAGEQARAGLGRYLLNYVLDGLIEDVEKWTYEVKKKHSCWPEALNSFGILLQHKKEKLSPVVIEKVKTLVFALGPKSLDDRIQFFLMKMPYVYLEDETTALDSYDQRCQELKKLVGELLEHEDRLKGLILELCASQHSMAQLFGHYLAEQAQDPSCWEKQIMEAFVSVPFNERSLDILTGYMSGIKERNPERFREFKQQALKSPVLAPVLPGLARSTGISSEDVGMMIEALEAGLITHEEMIEWKYGEALPELRPAEVAPLFDLMLKKEDPLLFAVAVELMFSYSYGQEELLEHLRPQLLLVAGYPSAKKEDAYDRSCAYKYKVLIDWIMSKGSKDADARKVAITIVRQLADEDLTYDGKKMIAQILSGLLLNFAEIAWPLIGQAIKENDSKRWRLARILRNEPFAGGKPSPILSVPEDTLFGWCYANPETGPAFLATAFPVLAERSEETGSEQFHPTIKRLLDEFGEQDEVLDGLESSIHTFTWLGSSMEYFARYREPLLSIENHDKKTVRRWAKKMLDGIKIEA
jgi:DNA-binding transcriptional regulator YiaG